MLATDNKPNILYICTYPKRSVRNKKNIQLLFIQHISKKITNTALSTLLDGGIDVRS